MRLFVKKDDIKILYDGIHKINEDPSYFMLGTLANEIQSEMGYEFVVDKWPDCTIVIGKSTEKAFSDLLPPRSEVYCTREGLKTLKHFLLNNYSSFINWNKAHVFVGEPFVEHSPHIKEEVNKMLKDVGGISNNMQTKYFYLNDKQNLPQIKLPEEYTYDVLRQEDITQVTLDWKKPKGLGKYYVYVQFCSEHFPNVAVRHKASGKLVGYEMINHNGAMMALFVSPSHRGKGLAQCIITQLSSKLLSGEPPRPAFCGINEKNYTSQRLHLKCGFKRYTDAGLCNYLPLSLTNI